MAKTKVVSTYQYPSRFGSHSSMIKSRDGTIVVCTDEFGDYTTQAWRLDNGLTDPNRTSQKRLGRLFDGSIKKEEKGKKK